MQLYYLDEPLSEAEIAELGSIIRRSDWIDDQPEIVQHRVPILFPVPDQEGRYGRRLSRYVPLLRKQLVRAGVASRGDEVIAFVMPTQTMQAAGVLALALSEVAGRAPYLVIRGHETIPKVRLVDCRELMRRLEYRSSAGPYHAHRSHSK